MKVLYIDCNDSGHHSLYMKKLCEIGNIDKCFILPRKGEENGNRIYVIPELKRKIDTPMDYLKILMNIKKILKQEKPDVVHILTGDMLFKYFGIGLGMFKKYKTVVTFHHVNFSFMRNLSYKLIFKNIYKGVVHTEYILEKFRNIKINNITHIEYPYMEDICDTLVEEIKKKYSIPCNIPILLAFGETRFHKGIDILLKALQGIEEDFFLIIAGRENEISRAEILELSCTYKQKILLDMNYIDQKYMEELFAVTDIVVLPYRKEFAGASGPLTSGVANGKAIIGPNYNSIGDIIGRKHVGYTFEVENIESLRNVLKEAIKDKFCYDDVAIRYQTELEVSSFKSYYEKIYWEDAKRNTGA